MFIQPLSWFGVKDTLEPETIKTFSDINISSHLFCVATKVSHKKKKRKTFIYHTAGKFALIGTLSSQALNQAPTFGKITK